MNFNADIIKVPFKQGHSHFHDYIESFPLPKDQPTLDQQHDDIQSQLRDQFINDNNWEQKLCLRNCFKLSQKRYVEFCLDRKCGGADFQKAANILGYTKN